MSEHADSAYNLFGARAGGITPRKESTGTERAEGLANILKEYLHPMVMYQGSLDKTQENYQKQIDQVKEIEDFNHWWRLMPRSPVAICLLGNHVGCFRCRKTMAVQSD